jgi:cobalt/nickel transport system permease protein
MNKNQTIGAMLLLAAVALPSTAGAMHITEGILPPQWAGLWFIVSLPFVAWGLRDLNAKSRIDPSFKLLVGLVGAAIFVISCMPIPVPTAGTCSHPCGTGMGAIIIGPTLTVVVSSIALLLQALFLSHGGLTTLGGNILSMGIVGAFSGWAVFRITRKMGMPVWIAAFLCGVVSDWTTYATTSFELASALHGDGSMLKMFTTIAISFIPTQLPLGLFEGVLTAVVYQFISARRPGLIEGLGRKKSRTAVEVN